MSSFYRRTMKDFFNNHDEETYCITNENNRWYYVTYNLVILYLYGYELNIFNENNIINPGILFLYFLHILLYIFNSN